MLQIRMRARTILIVSILQNRTNVKRNLSISAQGSAACIFVSDWKSGGQKHLSRKAEDRYPKGYLSSLCIFAGFITVQVVCPVYQAQAVWAAWAD